MRRTLGWMLMLVVLTLLGGACASSGGQKPPARLRARLPTPWPDTLYGGIPEARFAKALQRLRTWGYDSTHPALIVDPQTQRMVYVAPGPTPTPKRWFAISTSRYGFSNQAGLACTPPGVHRIKERYGAGAPIGMSFRGRVATAKNPAPIKGQALIATTATCTSTAHRRRACWDDPLRMGASGCGTAS